MKTTDFPILMFPKPAPADRTKRKRGASEPHKPEAKENYQRMAPRLEELQEVIRKMDMQIQSGAEGVEPESVLVLETVGRVDDFRTAVQRVPGLEWLMEEDFDAAPDEEFYFENKKGERTNRKLSSRLYLVSTNKEALEMLVNLYARYSDNPDTDFDPGYAGFKSVFEQLRTIRTWNFTDRLDGSNSVEDWISSHELQPDRNLKFQIELWYRNSEQKRNKAQSDVVDLVKTSGGRVISISHIPEIRYQALLVEVTGGSLRQIIQLLEGGSLIHSPEVMYFKPMPQTMFDFISDEDIVQMEEAVDEPQPKGQPVVALLDGCPMQNHSLLKGRLVFDDPDGYDGRYAAKQRQHGTNMASLIIHGDMRARGEALDTPLYVRPIMIPFGDSEEMPENMLAVDLVHMAVRRLFESVNGQPPVAPTVKIINFSIGDWQRKFYRTMSPMAKLLDWLSYKYNVLFVISAGNVNRDIITTGCRYEDFKTRGQKNISKFIMEKLLEKRIENTLLAPAESINNLTVGSIHNDASEVPTYPLMANPYTCTHPALYTPFGGGFRHAIKPDLVYDGGRQLLQPDVAGIDKLKPYTKLRNPGMLVAWPDDAYGVMAYTRGTSCSTALVSRHAYHCYQALDQVLNMYGQSNSHIHLLVKAMTVHGCGWEELSANIQQFLPAGTDTRKAKMIKRQLIGYGRPDLEKSLICNEHRATVVGYGELQSGKAHIYKLPLPEALDNQQVKRRVTVTLTWMSPIAAQNQKYRKARMWFEFTENKDIAPKRIDVADASAPKLGTLQHEVFEGEKRYPLPLVDPCLGIKVNCADDAGDFKEPIKYAIAVSVEMAYGVQLGLFVRNIYDEIRERLLVKNPITVANN